MKNISCSNQHYFPVTKYEHCHQMWFYNRFDHHV